MWDIIILNIIDVSRFYEHLVNILKRLKSTALNIFDDIDISRELSLKLKEVKKLILMIDM